MSVDGWEGLGQPEWKVEGWKQSGYSPADIRRWMEKIESRTTEHEAAWARVVAGDWPGVDAAVAITAHASARKALRASSGRVGFGVVAPGAYPYAGGSRDHIDPDEWNEFLVVVTDGENDALTGAALACELVAQLEASNRPLDTSLVALLDNSAKGLAAALEPEPEFVYTDLLMHLGPILFTTPEAQRLGLLVAAE